MSVVCLDTHKLQNDNTPFYNGVQTYSDTEAKEISKELQKGYMKLLMQSKEFSN